MDERVYQSPTFSKKRLGKLSGEYKRFGIRLSYTYLDSILNSKGNSESERSSTYSCILSSNEEQKILSEVEVKGHLWSVIGNVEKNVRLTDNTITYFLALYVHVQPALNAEESATLEVSCSYSNETCFEIRPSAIPRGKYGPYKIEITIPTHRKIVGYEILTLTLGIENVADHTEKQPRPTPMNSFLEYSNELFQNHELSDVTLKIRGKEFPAHKLLLSSLSPVFKTMFRSDFCESLRNVVEIKDFEFEVIQEMLKFMYTHKLPEFRSLEGNVDTLSLYKASHKYEIQYLLESCRQELLSTINIESALDVLLLADIYEDAFLKEKALDFICKNPPAVDDVSKYEEIVRQRPGLMKDILTCKFKQK